MVNIENAVAMHVLVIDMRRLAVNVLMATLSMKHRSVVLAIIAEVATDYLMKPTALMAQPLHLMAAAVPEQFAQPAPRNRMLIRPAALMVSKTKMMDAVAPTWYAKAV